MPTPGRAQSLPEGLLLLLAALVCASRAEARLRAQSGCAAEVVAQELDAGGAGPVLWTPDGPPVLEGPFSLQVIDGPPLAPGALLYSPSAAPVFLPLFGATFFPAHPLRVQPFVLDPAGDSPLLVAPPALRSALFPCGGEFVAQAAVLDPSAPGGAALSNGLQLRIGAAFLPTFPELHLPIEGTPVALALEDLDGDGDADMAVTNASTDEIAVLLGQGDGGFGDATGFGPAFGRGIATGDLDGDGLPDLATAGSDLVTVLLGAGGGSFLTPATFAAGGLHSFGDLAMGDFDGDGALDVTLASFNSDQVTVMPGHGDGTLGSPLDSFANDQPLSLASADLDGDGAPDVAVGNQSGSGGVSILHGIGDGRFLPPLRVETGGKASSLALADFDADGKLDLAAANNLVSDSVSVLLQESGGFGPAVGYPVGNEPLSIKAADLNGDAVIDLVTADMLSRAVSVLLGQGDGAFHMAVAHAMSANPGFVAVADIDADGAADAATVSSGSSYHVALLMGRGDGALVGSATEPYGPSSFFPFPGSVATEDLNGDAIADLAVPSVSDDVAVLLGKGGGRFAAALTFATGCFPRAVLAEDLDGDALLDLAVLNESCSPGGSVSVMLGHGDGTFGAGAELATAGAGSLAIGDVDQDGAADLLVAGNSGAPAFPDELYLLLGLGNGAFSPPRGLIGGQFVSWASLADLDANGTLDIAFASWVLSRVSVMLGAGDGTFSAPEDFPAGSHPESLAVGDLDGDLDLDLAAAIADGVTVLLANGDGTFGAPQTYTLGPGPQSVCIGDFDGNGSSDLAVTLAMTDEVAVLPAAAGAPGTFELPTRYGTGGLPMTVAAGDLDHDGALDLVVVGAQSHDVTILLNQVGEGPPLE